MVAKTANEIWRDFETTGVPASGAHKPIKADIREWGTQFEFLGGFNAPGADTSAALFSAGVGVAPVWRKPVGIDLPYASEIVQGAVFAKPAVAGQVLSGLGTDGEFDTLAVAGSGSVVLNNNPVFSGTIYFDPSIPFATASPPGNHIIYGPDGRLAIHLQNSIAFNKANLTNWTDDSGSVHFGSLSSQQLEYTFAALPSGATTPCFKITQDWNTGSGLVNGVDWQFRITSSNPGSKVFRIRGGTAGNVELFGVNADFNNPAIFMVGRTLLACPTGLPTRIYASLQGTAFVNAAGGKELATITNTGIWAFAGSSTGTHSLEAAAAASGASTFPNTSGELHNSGVGSIQTYVGADVDLNVANVDIPITFKVPPNIPRFRISAQMLNIGPGAASITTAQIAVYTLPGAGGLVLLLPQALTTLTSNTEGAAGAQMNLTMNPAVGALHWWNAASFNTVYVRVTTAQGAAAKGRFLLGVQQLG